MPLLEKARFSRGRKAEFKRWYHRQLFQTIGDRQELERNWEDAIIQWRAKFPEGEKRFPWPGAANLEFPLTAMHSDPVYADFMTTLHGPSDYWHVQPRRGEAVGKANALREALTALNEDFLKMRDVNERALLDLIVLGTVVYKAHWEDFERKVRDYNDVGEIETKIKSESRPLVEHVPLWDFYVPANARDIDPDASVGGAQWVAQQFELRAEELMARADRDGDLIPAYDKKAAQFVRDFEVDTQRPDDEDIERTVEEEDDFVPFEDPKIELYEVWARFDVDGDGIEEEIVVIWHQTTSTILRVLHNPFLHGKRPFVVSRYLPGFGFYGLGVAEIDEWAQATSTKLLNATIDNVTLANTRMFSAPVGSNISPGESIYPGKIWMVEPNEEIGEIRLGEVYPSIFQMLGMTQEWSEQRTGVSELRQGNIQNLPSRTPAATTLNALQQSNKRFDMILGNLRRDHGTIGLRVLQMLAQYFREDPVKWQLYFRRTLGEQDAARVVETLRDLGIQDIANGFGVVLSATSAQANKEAEKQNFIGLLQVISQIYPQLIQTAQMAEQMPGSMAGQAAASAFSGGIELLTRLLERFEIENPSEYLPSRQQAAQLQQQTGAGAQPQLGALGGPQGAGPFAQGPNQIAQLLGL